MTRGPLDIAIIGLGALFPGRGTTLGFWRDIVEGVDAIGPVPATHWLAEDYYDPDPRTPDRTYGARGGFLRPVAFEPVTFGIPPAQLESTDSAQLLALIVAHAVLAEAERESGGRIDRARTSCVLGVASATELVAHMAGRLQRPAVEDAAREMGLPESAVQRLSRAFEARFSPWTEASFPGMLGNVVAGRIANRLDLGGSNFVTDAACASSLAALHIACHELAAGDSDMVIAGGVDALNDILMYMCFSKAPALSPTGDCRPFSAEADGTMLGEGVGLLALRRLADAEADGNRIHAVIKGLGGGSDGRATAIYAPLPEGQARTLKRAYAMAGYGPQTIGLMEAHGTGTKAGDAAELAGLRAVFGPARESGFATALGSVKSQIGHTKAAAGAASLAKTVLALSRRVLPPTIKVAAPARALADSAFCLSTRARPWVREAGFPRRASVSSFGFGGSNFHVTLEEYTGTHQPVRERVHPAELVLLSAADASALAAALDRLAEGLGEEGDLARAASASHGAFERSAPARLALVAASEPDARDKAARLAALLRTGQALSAPLPGGCSVSLEPARPGRLAFLFPGQGSQSVGMGAALAMAFPQALAAWDRASAHPATAPLRLHDLAFPPSAFTEAEAKAQEARLTALENAQPALAAATLAHLGVLAALGLKPEAACGHSFGEVMALHAAGVLSADDALFVATARAACMAQAAAGTDGAMLAVQAGAGALAPYLAQAHDLVLANDNAPTQTVLSGPTPAIEAMAARLNAAGIKARRLPVASAFHSDIVRGAVAPFAAALRDVGVAEPAFAVYANATAAPYPTGPDAIRARLAAQIGEPVRFREMILAMADAGFSTFVEVGPGTVVSTLARQCLEGRDALILATDQKGPEGLGAFVAGLGRLAVAGHPLDLAALYAGQPAPAPAPKPSRHAVLITGANLNKPYPPRAGASARHKPNPETASPFLPPTTETELPAMSASSRDPAIERIYADMARRHSEFLQMAGAVHQQFLNATAALFGGASAPVAALSLPQPPAVAPAPMAPAPVAPASIAPAPVAPPSLANGQDSHPVATLSRPPSDPLPTPSIPSGAARSDRIEPAGNLAALVTAIVAEKTGYPADMLDPDMDLESELGVDSIKQVEILSTLRERLPDLPDLDPTQMAELRSIGKIAAFFA